MWTNSKRLFSTVGRLPAPGGGGPRKYLYIFSALVTIPGVYFWHKSKDEILVDSTLDEKPDSKVEIIDQVQLTDLKGKEDLESMKIQLD